MPARSMQPGTALSPAEAKTQVILENNIALGKKLLLATLGEDVWLGGVCVATVWEGGGEGG